MISRRTFAKAAAGAGVAVALPRSASAQSKELRILAYEGYLEPEWVTPFEERYGAKVQIAYTGSVDETFARIQGSKGSDFDLTTFD